MIRIFTYILAVLFVSGCSYKHDTLYKEGKNRTEQAVANTKKAELFQKGKIKIFITATYLDSLDYRDSKEYEEFVVGLHFPSIDNRELDKEKVLKNTFFKIEGNKPILVKKLKRDDFLLSMVPAANPWSFYYLVKAKKIDSNFVDLEIYIDDFKSIKFKFEKDY